MASIKAPVLTKQIVDEIVVQVKASAPGTAAKVVQAGDVQRIAAINDLSLFIPGFFVKPDNATYDGLDAAGTHYRVTETFRICYAYSIQGIATDVYDTAFDDLNSVSTKLAVDPYLSAIASAIRPNQIEVAGPAGVEYNPEEDEFLAERSVPVKVVALVWGIQWLAR